MAAATPPRKRAPRKATPKLASVPSDLEPQRRDVPAGPVVIGANPRPQVEVFTFDDVTYSIPDQINPLVSNRYMEKLKTEGPIVAAVWLLRRLFGDDVIEALEEAPYVSPEDIVALSNKVGSILFPPAEESGEAGAAGN